MTIANKSKASTSSAKIINSTAMLGTVSILVILIGFVRIKFIAEFIGLTGVGLIGILQSAVALGTSVTGSALSNGAVRNLAIAHESRQRQADIRYALFGLIYGAGIFITILVYLFRDQITTRFFNSDVETWYVGLIGLTVFVSLIANGQLAILQGFRRMKEIALLKLLASFSGTILVVVAVANWDRAGAALSVLLLPLSQVLVGFWFIRQVVKVSSSSLSAILLEARKLLKFGFFIMLSGAVYATVQFLVMSMVTRHGGLDAAGQLYATLTLSSQSIGFFLASMQLDYFPRLSQHAAKARHIFALVNRQTDIGLRLVGPVLIVAAAASESIMAFVFTEEFRGAGELFGWWLVGEALRIPVWAMGFVFFARAELKTFFILQLLGNLTYGLIALAIIETTDSFSMLAIANIVTGLVLLVATTLVLARNGIFRWSKSVIGRILVIMLLIVTLRILVIFSPLLAMLLGLPVALVLFVFDLRGIVVKLGTGNRIALVLRRFYRLIGWPLQ